MNRISHLLACVSIASLMTGALAQDGANPLGGPPVAEPTAAEAVEMGLDGSVEAPEGPVGVAALKAIELPEEQGEAVEAILAERASVVDSIIVESYDDVLEMVNGFQSARGGGAADGQEDARAASRKMMQLVVQLRRVMKPLMDRGTLEEEIAGVLTDAQLEQYQSVVDTLHVAARVRDMANRGQRDDDDRRRGGMMEERPRAYASTLRELGDGLDRVVGQRARDFNERLEDSGLPAALQEKIRVWAMEYSSENGMNAAQQNPGGAIRALLGTLEASERRAVIGWYQRLAREDMGR